MLPDSIPTELQRAVQTGTPVATNEAQRRELIENENREAAEFAALEALVPTAGSLCISCWRRRATYGALCYRCNSSAVAHERGAR